MNPAPPIPYDDQKPLPPGWTAAWDHNYGRYYFISPQGASTWYDPRVTPAAAGSTVGSSVAGQAGGADTTSGSSAAAAGAARTATTATTTTTTTVSEVSTVKEVESLKKDKAPATAVPATTTLPKARSPTPTNSTSTSPTDPNFQPVPPKRTSVIVPKKASTSSLNSSAPTAPSDIVAPSQFTSTTTSSDSNAASIALADAAARGATSAATAKALEARRSLPPAGDGEALPVYSSGGTVERPKSPEKVYGLSAKEEKEMLKRRDAEENASAGVGASAASGAGVYGLQHKQSFTDVPLDGGNPARYSGMSAGSFHGAESYGSTAPIMGAAGNRNSYYDNNNYGYTPLEATGGSSSGAGRTTSPQPIDPVIQKMFEANAAATAANSAVSLSHPSLYHANAALPPTPHQPASYPVSGQYATPQPQQQYNPYGPAYAAGAVGTQYPAGIGAGGYSPIATEPEGRRGSLVDQQQQQGTATMTSGSSRSDPANVLRTEHRTSTLPAGLQPKPPGAVNTGMGGSGTGLTASGAGAAGAAVVQPGVGGGLKGRRGRNGSGRFCCGCFRTRAGCCTFWWTFVVLILAGLAVAGWFLYPRIPNVVVSDPYANGKGLVVSGDLVTASADKPYTIEFDMMTDVSVYSPNYVDVKVDVLNFQGILLDESGKEVNARANGQNKDVSFPSMKNTTFTINIRLTYAITSPGTLIEVVALTDPVLKILAKSCGLIGSGSRPNLRMSYTTDLTIGLISWTGYKPSFGGKLDFACPVGADAFKALLGRRGIEVRENGEILYRRERDLERRRRGFRSNLNQRYANAPTDHFSNKKKNNNEYSRQPLPPGWTAAWDPNYGRYYFISPQKVTTWHDPRLPSQLAGTSIPTSSPIIADNHVVYDATSVDLHSPPHLDAHQTMSPMSATMPEGDELKNGPVPPKRASTKLMKKQSTVSSFKSVEEKSEKGSVKGSQVFGRKSVLEAVSEGHGHGEKERSASVHSTPSVIAVPHMHTAASSSNLAGQRTSVMSPPPHSPVPIHDPRLSYASQPAVDPRMSYTSQPALVPRMSYGSQHVDPRMSLISQHSVTMDPRMSYMPPPTASGMGDPCMSYNAYSAAPLPAHSSASHGHLSMPPPPHSSASNGHLSMQFSTSAVPPPPHMAPHQQQHLDYPQLQYAQHQQQPYHVALADTIQQHQVHQSGTIRSESTHAVSPVHATTETTPMLTIQTGCHVPSSTPASPSTPAALDHNEKKGRKGKKGHKGSGDHNSTVVTNVKVVDGDDADKRFCGCFKTKRGCCAF
ncbi:hypothetical protein HDU97_000920, partial [Phlyctochytrium planicorne]